MSTVAKYLLSAALVLELAGTARSSVMCTVSGTHDLRAFPNGPLRGKLPAGAARGPTYISPVTYETYTCPQLAQEAQRVSSRAAQAAGVQEQKATNDKVAMGVGLIIF